MAIFFTSDTHYYHSNIIKHCDRPYSCIEEMHEQLIKNWNRKVTSQDETYILGDFALHHKPMYIAAILMQLNGTKRLMKGNHDRTKTWNKLKYFDIPNVIFEPAYLELNDNDQKIVLCHYPFLSWNNMHHGSLHFHGHCHGNIPSTNQRYDVGIDNNDYHPISLSGIREKLKTLPKHRSHEKDHHQVGG